jgi:hypothetical protein
LTVGVITVNKIFPSGDNLYAEENCTALTKQESDILSCFVIPRVNLIKFLIQVGNKQIKKIHYEWQYAVKL